MKVNTNLSPSQIQYKKEFAEVQRDGEVTYKKGTLFQNVQLIAKHIEAQSLKANFVDYNA